MPERTTPRRARRHTARVVLVALAGLLAVPANAAAKPRHRRHATTTIATSLRARPGEAARVIAPLARGARVRVLRRKGRWLRVEVAGKRGWITRTTVATQRRRRSRRHRSSRWRARAPGAPSDAAAHRPAARPVDAGGPKVTVLARRADVFARPSARALVAFRVHGGDVLVVAGHARRRHWLLVDAGRGRTGWIAAAAVGRAAGAGVPGAGVDVAVARVRTASRAPRRPVPRFAVRGAAGLGVRSLGMDFTSDVRAGLGNYVVATQAAAVGVGGELSWQVGRRFVVGADVRYGLARSAPGIRYQASTGEMGDIAFASHELDGGARVGVRFGGRTAPVDLFARGGAHYEAFLVDSLGNVGHLPSESLHGVTAGLGVEAPRVDDDLGLSAGVDLLFGGVRSQTQGLEDGAVDSAGALWARVGLAYRVGDALDLSARYRYSRATTRWTGPSARVPDVDGAERRDHAHSVLLGLRYEL